MTEGIVIALIGMVGLVIAGLLTIIGQQLSAKNTARERHDAIHAQLDEAKDARETIKSDVHAVKAELPPDGLASWGRTITANTKALAAQAKATTQLTETTERLAETLHEYGERLEGVEGIVAGLQAGGTA